MQHSHPKITSFNIFKISWYSDRDLSAPYDRISIIEYDQMIKSYYVWLFVDTWCWHEYFMISWKGTDKFFRLIPPWWNQLLSSPTRPLAIFNCNLRWMVKLVGPQKMRSVWKLFISFLREETFVMGSNKTKNLIGSYKRRCSAMSMNLFLTKKYDMKLIL